MEETTKVTTFSPGLNENALPKEASQQTTLSADEAPVEGDDSRASSTTTPQQADDTVCQGTDEEICGDERDIGEDSTLVEIDSEVSDNRADIKTASDGHDTVRHGRHRFSILNSIDAQFTKAVKQSKAYVADASRRFAAKLDEPGSAGGLHKTNSATADNKMKVDISVEFSNLPFRPVDPSIPHDGMDASRQRDGGEAALKLNIETKIQAVASC